MPVTLTQTPRALWLFDFGIAVFAAAAVGFVTVRPFVHLSDCRRSGDDVRVHAATQTVDRVGDANCAYIISSETIR